MSCNFDREKFFIGIGAPRSGSTWIYECLKEHPEICVSNEKETNFFMANNIQHIKAYNKFFSHCKEEKMCGEFSPRYLYNEKAAENIHNFLPDSKLIICLRNPINRIESRINYDKGKGTTRIKGPIWNFIEKRPSFVEGSKYHKQLQKFLSKFSSNQIYIAVFEDIKKDPINFIQNVYQFLGVKDDFIPKTAQIKINQAKEMRPLSPKFQRILRTMRGIAVKHKSQKNYIPLLKFFHFDNFFSKMLQLNKNLGRRIKKPPHQLSFDKREREKMYSYFKDDIKDLEKLIGRSLNFWR